MKIELCSFSGYKIYPGKGKLFVRSDSKIQRFVSCKVASLALQRKNPRKLAWTQVSRRMHKKGITEEIARRRSRKTVKANRGIVGASTAQISALKNQNAAVRQAARDAAVKKAKEAKNAKKPAAGAKAPGAAAAAQQQQHNKISRHANKSAGAPKVGGRR